MNTAAGFASLVDSDPALFDVQTKAVGPAGSLPLTEELLHEAPSGDLFGWSQDVGMGWEAVELRRRRHAHRARLPHRSLGSRPADEGCR